MPEYYSFVTSPFMKGGMKEICSELYEHEIQFTVLQFFGRYIISGISCEEDCGAPMNLIMIFEKNEYDIEVVFQTWAGDYGYIGKGFEVKQFKLQP